MKITAITVIIAAAIVGTAVGAAPNRATVFRAGKWTVSRFIDEMSDKVICTGHYTSNSKVSMKDDGLYIYFAGGAESVRLRYDDEPQRALRDTRHLEKALSSAIIDLMEFTDLRRHDRLRVVIGGRRDVSPIIEIDVSETSGIWAALENIRAGCPVTEQPVSPSALPQPDACSDGMVTRMRAAKISSAQIAKVCGR